MSWQFAMNFTVKKFGEIGKIYFSPKVSSKKPPV